MKSNAIDEYVINSKADKGGRSSVLNSAINFMPQSNSTSMLPNLKAFEHRPSLAIPIKSQIHIKPVAKYTDV